MRTDLAIDFQNFSRGTGTNVIFSDPPRRTEHFFEDFERDPDHLFPDFEVGGRRRGGRQKEGVLLQDLAGTRILEVSEETMMNLAQNIYNLVLKLF